MANARYYSSIAQQTSLTSGITSGSTSIAVASTTGFPGSTPYTLSIDYGSAGEELVDVTMVAGLSLTVTRAVDGTSATSHNAGAVVRHVSSARDFTESRTHEGGEDQVHGLTGVGNDVVGTTETQTLVNKTLDHATGTLRNVDIFNVGSWVTSVIGDSTQPALSKLAILNNEVALQEMAVFTGAGALYLYKQTGDVDGSYRLRMTDSDTTTDRFFVLAGGTSKLVPTTTTTFPGIDLAAPDTSTSKRAVRVSANGGTTERFTIWNSGQVDISPTASATSGLNVRVASGATPVERIFAANPGPQTADLTQWVNSSNVVAARVTASGEMSWTGSAWTTYTPTLTSDGTNPTLGNSTLVGRYQKFGRTVILHINLIAGSTWAPGTGGYNFTLPFTSASNGCTFVGNAHILGADRWGGQALISPNDTTAAAYVTASATNPQLGKFSGTLPEAFGNGDQFRLDITYEAVS